MQVNIPEAKSRLPQLVQRVLKGEKAVITKAGQPLVDLVPHRAQQVPRHPGRLKGRVRMAPDFDRTPDEVIDGFEGR